MDLFSLYLTGRILGETKKVNKALNDLNTDNSRLNITISQYQDREDLFKRFVIACGKLDELFLKNSQIIPSDLLNLYCNPQDIQAHEAELYQTLRNILVDMCNKHGYEIGGSVPQNNSLPTQSK